MAIYALDDGSFLKDDTSSLFYIGGGFVKGVGSAGTILSWVAAGDSVAATAVSLLTAVSAYTNSGDGIVAAVAVGGASLGGRVYAIDNEFVSDDGARTHPVAFSFITRTSDTVAERNAVFAVTQAGDSYVFTADVGAASSVSLTLVYSQDANTLSGAVGDTREPGAIYAQDDNTLSSAGIVKRVLLQALGELDVGAIVAYTQDGNVHTIVADSGSNNVFYVQADNLLSAEAFVLGNLSAVTSYTQEDNSHIIRGNSAAIWGGVSFDSDTWTTVTHDTDSWTPV